MTTERVRAQAALNGGATRALEGRVGVVTGAARGIGRAIAVAAANAGAELVLNDILVEDLAATSATIRLGGTRVMEAPGDVTDVDLTASLAHRAIDDLGRLDFVVSNAAAFRSERFLDLSLEDFDAVLGVNLRATFILDQSAARLWVDGGRPGVILNVSSVSASFAQPRMAHYGASKAAIERMTRNIALELAPHGIRANCIAPGGPINSEYVQAVMERPDYKEYSALRPPMGRLGDPHEIADAAVFLLSDQASYITGTVLTIDGGLTLGRTYGTKPAPASEAPVPIASRRLARTRGR